MLSDFDCFPLFQLFSLLWLNFFEAFHRQKAGRGHGGGARTLWSCSVSIPLFLLYSSILRRDRYRTRKLLLSWLDLWRRGLILPYPGIQHYSWKPLVTTSWLYLSTFGSTGLGHFITQYVTLRKHFLQDWLDTEKGYANNNQAQISEGQLRRWVMKGFGRFLAWAVH